MLTTRFIILPTAVALYAASLFACHEAHAQTNGSKCTSPQQMCALQNGGRCDPKTGRWGIGGYEWGGNHNGWLQCLGDIYSKRLNANGRK